MPWPITWRGERPERLEVGDAYFVEEDAVRERTDGTLVAYELPLSRHYLAIRTTRRPIAIVMPDRYPLCIDTAYWSSGRANPEKDGWLVRVDGPLVVGERLHVTLNPSVNLGGSYHGWVTDGVLSDDVEGRRFA